MSHPTESLMREFETACGVSVELSNAAVDVLFDAANKLLVAVSAGTGLSALEVQKINALLEAYEDKRNALWEAEARKDAAARTLFTELRHPHPA